MSVLRLCIGKKDRMRIKVLQRHRTNSKYIHMLFIYVYIQYTHTHKTITIKITKIPVTLKSFFIHFCNPFFCPSPTSPPHSQSALSVPIDKFIFPRTLC